MSDLHRIVLTVVLGDGTVHENVAVTVADRVRYSRTARKQQWPAIQDDPDFASIFLGWAALHRTGQFPGTWDEFTDTAQHVEAVGEEPVVPTIPATPDT